MKHELRFTGSGGQGVIMATIILAEAAYYDGKQAVQCQSYGPEARGGSCKAECIVDEKTIAYTKVGHPTLLLSLTQVSFDKYRTLLNDDAIIVVDSEIEVPKMYFDNYKVYQLPILESAKTVIGNPMSANIICCGIVNEILDLAEWDKVEEAVVNHIPKGTEELNLKALHYGEELAKNYK